MRKAKYDVCEWRKDIGWGLNKVTRWWTLVTVLESISVEEKSKTSFGKCFLDIKNFLWPQLGMKEERPKRIYKRDTK